MSSPNPIRTRRRILLAFAVLGLACPIAICALGYGMFRSWFGGPSANLPRQLQLAKEEGVALEPSDLRPREPIPDDQNAATVYRGFFPRVERLFASSKDLRPQCQRLLRGESTPEDAAAVEKALEASRETVVELVAASKRMSCDFHYGYEDGFNVMFPEFATGKSAALLLLARAHLDADHGKVTEAFDEILAAERLGAHLAQTPVLISMLVFLAIDSMAMNEFEHVLGRSAEQPHLLAKAQQTLGDFGPLADMRYALRGEVVLGRIAIRTGRKMGDFEGLAGDVPESNSLPIPASLRTAFEAKFIDEWRQTFRDLPANPEDWTAAVRAMAKTDARVEADNSPAAVLNKILFPVFTQAAQAIGHQQANRRVMATSIRLMQDRSKSGAYPARLPPYGEISIDPFDGKPLRYSRVGSGFTLYSIDKDREDNGGKKPHGAQKGDLVRTFGS